MAEDIGGPSNIGLAIAIVSLARFIRLERPTLPPYLKLALDHAAASGISENDLKFMRTLVASIEPPRTKA